MYHHLQISYKDFLPSGDARGLLGLFLNSIPQPGYSNIILANQYSYPVLSVTNAECVEFVYQGSAEIGIFAGEPCGVQREQQCPKIFVEWGNQRTFEYELREASGQQKPYLTVIGGQRQDRCIGMFVLLYRLFC